MAALDDVANLIVGDVGLEIALDSRDGLGLFGFGIGDKLGELFFQQFILGLEPWDQPKDFLQYFP